MALRQLPIFPLPLVLFPGMPQLLHILEPRFHVSAALEIDVEAKQRLLELRSTAMRLRWLHDVLGQLRTVATEWDDTSA